MTDIDYSVVLDSHEREELLAEGYAPDVIDWMAKERWDSARSEFLRKNAILKSHFKETSYYDFASDIFADVEKVVVVTGEKTYKQMDIDELVDYQAMRNDVYVPPASFINGFYSGKGCKDILALVIDLDRMKPDVLKNILDNGNIGHMTPEPTYIVNSGSGVHFYYVFKDPVPHYYKNRPILKKLYQQLCKITKKNITAKTDFHALTQPFRLPGSQTKLQQTATGWKCSDKWDAHELARRIGVDSSNLDLQRHDLLSQKEYHAEKERRAKETGTSEKKGRRYWKSSADGNIGFYEYCLKRCFEETQEGSRYNSLVGLVVVAHKVRLGHTEAGMQRLEQDLLRLVAHYNKIGKRMSPKEAAKALRAYNPEADQCRGETLERWFGWEFGREAQKRREERKAKGLNAKKRTREETLELARKIQDAYYPEKEWINKSGAPSKEQEIRAWRFRNPKGKPADCIRETGISKNTVYKWWTKALVPNHAEQEKESQQEYKHFDWVALLAESIGLPKRRIEEIAQKVLKTGTLTVDDLLEGLDEGDEYESQYKEEPINEIEGAEPLREVTCFCCAHHGKSDGTASQCHCGIFNQQVNAERGFFCDKFKFQEHPIDAYPRRDLLEEDVRTALQWLDAGRIVRMGAAGRRMYADSSSTHADLYYRIDDTYERTNLGEERDVEQESTSVIDEKIRVSEEERQIRKDLDLPVSRALRYMRRVVGGFAEEAVTAYEIVETYQASGSKSLLVTLASGEKKRILAPYFSEMQHASFGKDK